MDRLILVLETLGAWLLFGAPLLQATTELHEEVAGWEKIRSKHAAAKKIDIGKVSFWWWLLPPLKVMFEKRRIRSIRKAYAEIKLSDETQERLYKYALKVNGWSGVTLGGWFVAISTTWELVNNFGLSLSAWGGLVIFLSYVSIIINMKLLIKK